MSLGILFWLLLGGEPVHAHIENLSTPVFCIVGSGYRFYAPGMQRWSTGDPQLAHNLNNTLAVTPIGLPNKCNALNQACNIVKPCKAAKTTEVVDQYALRAVEDGFYPVMKRGFAEPQGGVWLNAGDVWKYGTTMNPSTRYPKSFLEEWGLRYSPQNSGTLQESLASEKANILLYETVHGVLPPGNKVRR